MTALEGANGAGKTTVMIAAYVVLLPDMGKLRFTPVGETAPSGGDRGVYGRLGEPGRPSYAAISFRLADGRRLVAGVHLERRTQPTVEATTFVLEGLADDVCLDDVFLDRGDQDAVPELARLQELAVLRGVKFVRSETLRDYFGRLFEQGVTPLRLAGDEERTKLNEMLHTSMVGGISRALAGGLRDFLLKEESGLADSLKHMRENLRTCHQTRIEVEEATRLETEIHGIYEAGLRMFAAAVHATRLASDELRVREDAARQARDRARDALEDERRALESARRQLAETEARRARAHAERDASTELRARTQRANQIHRRCATLEQQLSVARAEVERRTAERSHAETARTEARAEREAAQQDRNRAAEGLADLEAGLEHLKRRASEHRLVRARLDQVQAGLRRPVDAQELGPAREALQREIDGVDKELARLAREQATAAVRKAEHDLALQALEQLRPRDRWSVTTMETAREALAELRRLDSLAAEASGLSAQLGTARRLAAEQKAARRAADELTTIVLPLTSSAAVQDAAELARLEHEQSVAREREAVATQARAEQRLQATEQLLSTLEQRHRRWRELRAVADPLSTRLGLPIGGRTDVERARTTVRDRGRDLHARRMQSERARAALSDEASRLATGGAFPDDLLRVRDALGGELLAARFEEVAPERAAEVEALLGPLRDAVVVDDVGSAVATLVGARGPSSVWLWDAREPLPLDASGRPPGEVRGDVAVVPAPGGQRVTRLPDLPTLGRRAREHRLTQLHLELGQLGERIAALHADERMCADDERALDELLVGADLLEQGNPSTALEAAQRSRDDDRSAVEDARGDLIAQRRRVEESHARSRALVGLLPRAHLLDLADQEEEAARLASRLAEARRAVDELKRAGDARARLEDRLDVLRDPPPTPEELAELVGRQAELAQRREDRWTVLVALEYVIGNEAALGWTDAEEALKAQGSLAPALKEQLAGAQARFEAAERRADDADRAWGTAVEAEQLARSKDAALDSALTQARAELAQVGVDDPSDAAVKALDQRVADAEAAVATAEEDARRDNKAVGRREAGVNTAEEALAARERHLQEEEAQARPAHERWTRLRDAAEAQRLLVATQSLAFQEAFGRLGSPNAWAKARDEHVRLTERLEKAERGAEIAMRLVGAKVEEGRRAEDYLEAWVLLRGWLLGRMPAQIAEVDEPLEALGRLRDHLVRLTVKLQHQERMLRGQSEDVAQNIETHIRKARANVNRLNDELARVRFGSICGVRIRVIPDDRMAQVLEALRAGGEQQVLFRPDLPIEQALEELFRRHGGGGRHGGQRLLDYREYLDLRIEIARQESQDSWELANTIRLSTGEAIGVGAAIMMVVLTSWERDSNLLRGKRAGGSLRLLFLDEATRLSQDNLLILFELCRTLELQLIIAAPEVAHGGGNTTYHLVRRVTNGREEVLVTGRRVVAEESA